MRESEERADALRQTSGSAQLDSAQPKSVLGFVDCLLFFRTFGDRCNFQIQCHSVSLYSG